MRERGRLDELRDPRLREFGGTLTFHEGVLEMFDWLRARVADRLQIQFFVISGGLLEVIAGSSIADELDDFWGCTFHWDEALEIPFPKNVVSFTEKTKHLFQISKGLIGDEYKNKPYEVNAYMDHTERHVPFENMIYIGDGLTDVPCFSILDNMSGHPACVYNDAKDRREGIQRSVERAKAKEFTKALEVTRHRGVRGPYKADYRRGTGVMDFLESMCEAKCTE